MGERKERKGRKQKTSLTGYIALKLSSDRTGTSWRFKISESQPPHVDSVYFSTTNAVRTNTINTEFNPLTDFNSE